MNYWWVGQHRGKLTNHKANDQIVDYTRGLKIYKLTLNRECLVTSGFGDENTRKPKGYYHEP